MATVPAGKDVPFLKIMKEKKTGFLSKYWFLVIFAVTLLVPLYGTFLDEKVVLSGVTSSVEKEEANLETIGDGRYQTYLNTRWENEFPGRKALLKLRNQLLYSLFKVSPNENVVIGKDGYLFEPNYIYNELMANGPYDESHYEELGQKLQELKNLLLAQGKEFYIFITPSKARFCREKIPERYMILDQKETVGFSQYEKLCENLEKYGIPYFDSIDYIEKNRETAGIKAPVFYATGIHWSHPWGVTCAAELLRFMKENSRYDLSTVSVEESPCGEPFFPATDLYDSLNLIRKPKDEWYKADAFIETEGTDKPNIFIRGGSFMGQSTTSLVWAEVFHKDVHFENYYYFTDKFTEQVMLSGFRDYEGVDLDRLIGQSDIVLFEVNEAAIWDLSFGLLDYLLEHPEYLDAAY